MCRLTNTEPSILLHPLDFIGNDDVGNLAFFPGMDVDVSHKLDMVTWVLDKLEKHYRLVTMQEHAAAVGTPAKTLTLEQGA